MCVLLDMSRFYYQSHSTFCICNLCSFVGHKAWQRILFCLSHLSPQLIKHSNLLIDEWILSFSCIFWPRFLVSRLVEYFENLSSMRVSATGFEPVHFLIFSSELSLFLPAMWFLCEYFYFFRTKLVSLWA